MIRAAEAISGFVTLFSVRIGPLTPSMLQNNKSPLSKLMKAKPSGSGRIADDRLHMGSSNE